MTLGTPIHLRLRPEIQLVYEELAALERKPLSTYLRERLEAEDTRRAELDSLRQELRVSMAAIIDAVERSDRQEQHAPDSGHQLSHTLLLEIVLLLREISGPERMRRTNAELARQGVKAWIPELSDSYRNSGVSR